MADKPSVGNSGLGLFSPQRTPEVVYGTVINPIIKLESQCMTFFNVRQQECYTEGSDWLKDHRGQIKEIMGAPNANLQTENKVDAQSAYKQAILQIKDKQADSQSANTSDKERSFNPINS